MQLNPSTDIDITSDRFRYAKREDLADLMDSITRLGQLQPILVTRNPLAGQPDEPPYTLVAGFRRLSAINCLKLPTVEALLREDVPPDVLKEMELEENVQRQDMTWQERAVAIATIHDLRKSRDPNWGQRETAALVGFKGHSNVALANMLARYIRAEDKDIVSATTPADAVRILNERKIAEVAATKKGKLDRLLTVPAPAAADGSSLQLSVDAQPGTTAPTLSLNIAERDCCAFLQELATAGHPPRVIYTDPPYAIDMDNLDQTNTGMQVNLVRDTHQVADNLSLLTRFVHAAYATMADPGWLVMWTDQDTWFQLAATATAAGFRVQRWPFIWVKLDHRFNQMPHSNFTKATEIAMVCAKGTATLAKTAPQNWYLGKADKPANVTNPFYKPLGLHEAVLAALAHPGSTITDPFCGSGSIAEACIKFGYNYNGCDIDPVHLADLHRRLKL